MKAQESLLEETLSSSNMKEDELEETLSLCDLPLYSDQSADWDQDFSLNSNSTSSSSQEDYFEFFSQEFNPSAATITSTTASFPSENIVFCGKLIPYKQVVSPCKTDSSNQVEIKKSSRWLWKLSSTKNSKRQSSVSKNGNKSTTALMQQQSPYKKMYNTKQLGKAKWYLFLFGISRFSPVVELSDIRSRQSRRQPPPLSPSSSPPPPTMMFGLGNEKASDRGWGLWGLIRALSCGGNHHPTTVPTVAPE